MGRLRRPVGEEARRLLSKAARAAGGSHPEALHDFRVALRRLHALFSAEDAHCGLPKSERRALRALLRATNAARDAQVELAWLARAAPALLRAARRRLRPEPPAAVIPRFAALRRRPEARLPERGRVRKSAARRAFAKLARRLERLGEDESSRALHRARVAGKALRYRLEWVGPVKGLPPAALLRALQDALGAVHDRDLLLADFARWGEAGPARARARRERALSLCRGRRLWASLVPRTRGRRAR